jgi:hypothetical protein
MYLMDGPLYEGVYYRFDRVSIRESFVRTYEFVSGACM